MPAMNTASANPITLPAIPRSSLAEIAATMSVTPSPKMNLMVPPLNAITALMIDSPPTQ